MTKPPVDPIYTLALTAFADRHRLRAVRLTDDEGKLAEKYVQGRSGFITEYSESRLHLVLSPGTGSAAWWTNRRRSAIAAGMTLDQDGDTEGSLIFDPSNRGQALTAIRISGSRQRRIVSESERADLLKRLQRRNSPANGTANSLEPTIAA